MSTPPITTKPVPDTPIHNSDQSQLYSKLERDIARITAAIGRLTIKEVTGFFLTKKIGHFFCL